VELSGSTVGEVLQDLCRRYPSVRDQLFEPDGSLRRFVNVYINNEDIQYLDKLETSTSRDDTVIILPAMAGGVCT